MVMAPAARGHPTVSRRKALGKVPIAQMDTIKKTIAVATRGAIVSETFTVPKSIHGYIRGEKACVCDYSTMPTRLPGAQSAVY